MSAFNRFLDWMGRKIAGRIQRPVPGYEPFAPSDRETLERVLQPCDVLLIEGNQKVSAAIKYLTQSTWSHAAMFVGPVSVRHDTGAAPEPAQLIEANLGEGVVAVPLSKYEKFNTRICRPIGLTPADRDAVIRFVVERIGQQYDTRHIFDLARYLLPTPPVPIRWRRRMIALGSGDPSRVICSTLIAQAFQHVRYPILPSISSADGPAPSAGNAYTRREILHIRHHSLFAPRDFDVSPFFSIIKPTLERGFDYKELIWGN